MPKSFVLLSLLVAGCASANAIYESGVDETATIQKPLAEVSQCLALRMGESPMVVDGKQTFPVKNGYGQTQALIALSGTSQGTLVEVSRRDKLVSTGMWKHCR